MQLYYVLISSLIFFFSLGHLGRISFLRQEVNVYIYEVVLVILTAVLIYLYRLRPLNIVRKPNKSLWIFISYLLFSYLISLPGFTGSQNFIGILFLLRLIAYLVFFIYFFYFVEKQKNKKLVVFLHLTTVGFFAMLIDTSIGQYFFYPDIRNLLYAGWDPHLNRLVGVFLEPPVSGAMYGLLFFYFLLQPKAISKPLRIVALIILSAFIFITFSRGTYLGFFLTLFFVLVRQLKLSRVYLSLICLLVVIGLLTVSQLSGEGAHLTRTSTIASRVANYQEAIHIWSKRPIFGVGYNHIRYIRDIKPDPNPVEGVSHAESAFHSSFLVILVAGGVIGLVLFMYVLFELGKISYYSMYSVLFLSISSLTDNVILHPFVLFFFLFLIAQSLSHLSDTSW